jgi:Domain of unknown function (DUF222)
VGRATRKGGQCPLPRTAEPPAVQATSVAGRVAAVRGRPGPRSGRALDSLITDLTADIDATGDAVEPGSTGSDTSRSPGRGGRGAAHSGSTGPGSVAGPPGVGPLSAVVDAVVGAQRLAGWALWVELAAIAKLVAAWRGAPPVLYSRLEPDPCESAEPGLAARLQWVISELDPGCLPDPGAVDTAEFAEEFVLSEVAAATGLSFRRARQRLDAAVAVFMTNRLPRTAVLLRAGLLDWTKLQTLLAGTAGLEDQTCRVVEARIIRDDDLLVADPLDVRADPARPGAPLPAVTKMTNPALERAVAAEVLAVDSEAAARRARKAREGRFVTAKPLPDGMGRLEVETGQEIVVAILGDLDSQVATAKAAGDTRRPDQIRCDELVHRMTFGAYGAPAIGAPTPAGLRRSGEPGEPDSLAGSGALGEPAPSRPSDPRFDEAGAGCARRYRRWGRRGLHVGLTMPLSTWLGVSEEPGLLDGYGPIPAALARQIASDAARDRPATTSWRCVVVGDEHRTVLGVGDLVPTPHHDPPPRLARLAATAEPRCVYPGCPVPAWRCDLDHRRPYEHGGPTCSCNLQPLCRRHHRLKTSGLIQVRSVTSAEEPAAPPGTVEWHSWTGRTYRHQPPEAAVAPVRESELAHAAGVETDRVLHEDFTAHSKVMDERYDQDWALRDWDRSLRKLHERPPRPTADARDSDNGAKGRHGDNGRHGDTGNRFTRPVSAPDDDPPF